MSEYRLTTNDIPWAKHYDENKRLPLPRGVGAVIPNPVGEGFTHLTSGQYRSVLGELADVPGSDEPIDEPVVLEDTRRPRLLSTENGPLNWYGLTFPNQEAKDAALGELQVKLDRITEMERRAQRDARTHIIGSSALTQARIETHGNSDETHAEGEQ